MKPLSLRLPEGWRRSLRQGRLLLAEIETNADAITPQALADAARERSGSAGPFFLLETQSSGQPRGMSLWAQGDSLTLLGKGKRSVWRQGGAPLDSSLPPEAIIEKLGPLLRQLGYAEAKVGLIPWICFMGYEAGARYEALKLPSLDPLGLPDWCFTLPAQWAHFDPDQGSWRFRLPLMDTVFFEALSIELQLTGPASHEFAMLNPEALVQSWVTSVQDLLQRARRPPATLKPKGHKLRIRDSSSLAAYSRSIAKIKKHIVAGDIYQANLSHRRECEFEGSAWDLYRSLSKINPSPYAAFADYTSYQIVCGSPERLFTLRGNKALTSPIAGTFPLKKETSGVVKSPKISEKEKAEHMMIVDLERNDLGRVCVAGSVKVLGLMKLETYSHLHQLVSHIEGQLKPHFDLPQLLRAGFPGGSITGAPKIRCMEILAEIEKEKRGFYTGSLGYWDPWHFQSDMNILIRTVLVAQGKAMWHVGGGIVADSDPEAEWLETLQKAKAIESALMAIA